MQFNRTKATEVIMKAAQFGKALEFYGLAITGTGRTLNKLCSNKDFQVEAVNSAELIYNTVLNRIRGLRDHYIHTVEEDVLSVLKNVDSSKKAMGEINGIKLEENKNTDNVFHFRDKPSRDCQ